MSMKSRWLGPVVAIAAMLAGCGNGDDSVAPAPKPDASMDSSVTTMDASKESGSNDAGVKMDGTVAEGGGDDGSTTDGMAEAGQTPVERGQYLVNYVLGCGDCHTPRLATGAPDTSKLFAGANNLFIIPGLGADGGLGVLNASNLTPDPTTGIGNWTDDQVKSAFLDGIDNNNKSLFPVMPYFVFHNMTADDANAVVAYLRSLPAISNTIAPRNFNYAPAAPPLPVADIPDTTLPTTDPNYASAERGKYLAATTGACIECHTIHLNGAPGSQVLDTTKLFAGGEDFPIAELGLPQPPFPNDIYSANVTPDSTGIMGWTAQNVVDVLHKGTDKNGVPLCPPMPFGTAMSMGDYGGLTPQDSLDIGNYITTLAPIAQDNGQLCGDFVANEMKDAGDQ
jgi:mono/diheme cytochrome c family protein